MMSYIGLAVALVCLIGVTGEQYTSKFDNVDVDSIITNDRLLNAYVNCVLGKGSCTPDGAELKRLLPDALNTECTKCNEKQKTNTRKVLKYIFDNKPQIWSDLEKAFDPSGEYKKKYCNLAKKEGTKVKACDA